jgi:hypothetical protein
MTGERLIQTESQQFRDLFDKVKIAVRLSAKLSITT